MVPGPVRVTLVPVTSRVAGSPPVGQELAVVVPEETPAADVEADGEQGTTDGALVLVCGISPTPAGAGSGTSRPAASETTRAGICVTRPSPR